MTKRKVQHMRPPAGYLEEPPPTIRQAVDIDETRRVATAATAVVDLLRPFESHRASRILLAVALLLDCDKLVCDLARTIVWAER